MTRSQIRHTLSFGRTPRKIKQKFNAKFWTMYRKKYQCKPFIKKELKQGYQLLKPMKKMPIKNMKLGKGYNEIGNTITHLKNVYNIFNKKELLEMKWITEEEAQMMKWAQDHTFEVPKTFKQILEKIAPELMNKRKYNKFLRSLTPGTWRDFLIAVRNYSAPRVFKVKRKPLIDTSCPLRKTWSNKYQREEAKIEAVYVMNHVLIDLIIAHPHNWKELWKDVQCPYEHLVTADFMLNGTKKYKIHTHFSPYTDDEHQETFHVDMQSYDNPFGFHSASDASDWVDKAKDIKNLILNTENIDNNYKRAQKVQETICNLKKKKEKILKNKVIVTYPEIFPWFSTERYAA